LTHANLGSLFDRETFAEGIVSFDPIRLAVRNLRKQPAFTVVVILSLAIGIALNTTMYGVLDALIKPRIDLREPGRLYRIRYYGDYRNTVDNLARDSALATGMHTYESITRSGYPNSGVLMQHGENVTEGTVQGVASNYFDVLGARPLAGRTFLPSDETSDASPVDIDETLAAQLFPDGTSPVGRKIIVNNEAHVVIGVLSSLGHLPGERANVWTIEPIERRGMYARIIRLRGGASPQDADRELRVLAGRFAAQSGENPKDVAFIFHQAADPNFQFRSIHFGLIAAVIAVLLVACANLANIQLARGIGRRRELALRSALGATRGRIIRHLLTESVLLGAAGLALGLVLTYWGGAALHASIPKSIGSYIVEPQMSWRVLVFALGATVFCLIAVGVAPAISVSRTDPNELLKSGAGTGATKQNRSRYAVLVGVEIALALALSTIAAATVHTWLVESRKGFGFDPRPLATGYIAPTFAAGTVARVSDLMQSIAARVKSVPGVTNAATSEPGPMLPGMSITVDDPGGAREKLMMGGNVMTVTPSYFRTLGMPIIAGRDFLDGGQDHASVIVDRRTARKLWPNANPVGALIKLGERKSDLPYVRVIGVVGEQKGFESDEDMPFTQQVIGRDGHIYYLPGPTDTIAVGKYVGTMAFIARTDAHPEQLAIALQHAIADWGDVRGSRVMSMPESLGIVQRMQNARFVAMLFILFAGIGVSLAAFGVYGVVAHAVAERRRELGVRVALGATRRDILNAVLRETLVVALSGAAGGLLLTKYGVALLGDIASVDLYNAPLFAVVTAAIVGVAAVSAFIPALRATRIDPTESLRAE
jgi:putative ABC transport system permease protein